LALLVAMSVLLDEVFPSVWFVLEMYGGVVAIAVLVREDWASPSNSAYQQVATLHDQN
jgi:hypothetical protein